MPGKVGATVAASDLFGVAENAVLASWASPTPAWLSPSVCAIVATVRF
jgi:hypothetical protein